MIDGITHRRDVRQDRQGIVHRWVVDHPLCDPHYSITISFSAFTYSGWFLLDADPQVTCFDCIATEGVHAARGR